MHSSKAVKAMAARQFQVQKRTKEGSNPPGMSLTKRLEAEIATRPKIQPRLKHRGKDKPLALIAWCASGHSARLQPSAARPRRVGAAGGGHCSAPPCNAPSLPLCSEGVGFPPRGRLRKESPTSPMSLLWLARPGPAFCLCAASRHVGARARFVRLSRRPFRVGGVEASLGLTAAGRKKA